MDCKTFNFQPIFAKLQAMLVHINVKKSLRLHQDSLKDLSATCLQTLHLATIRYFGLSLNSSDVSKYRTHKKVVPSTGSNFQVTLTKLGKPLERNQVHAPCKFRQDTIKNV